MLTLNGLRLISELIEKKGELISFKSRLVRRPTTTLEKFSFIILYLEVLNLTNMDNREQNQITVQDIFKKKWFWFAVVVIIFLWGLNWYLIDKYLDYNTGGQFGDRFGATTSLFGGFTILGLIITIVLQQIKFHCRDMKLNYKELRWMKRKKSIKKNKQFQYFFELMHLQNKVLENISTSNNPGRTALNLLRISLMGGLFKESFLSSIENKKMYSDLHD